MSFRESIRKDRKRSNYRRVKGNKERAKFTRFHRQVIRSREEEGSVEKCFIGKLKGRVKPRMFCRKIKGRKWILVGVTIKCRRMFT